MAATIGPSPFLRSSQRAELFHPVCVARLSLTHNFVSSAYTSTILFLFFCFFKRTVSFYAIAVTFLSIFVLIPSDSVQPEAR